MTTSRTISDLPQGTPGGYGQVIRLALPAVLAHFSNTAMMFVDNIFVGMVGKAELGAMGIAGVTAWVLCAPVTGTLTAVNVFSARLTGAGHHERVGGYLYHAFLFVAVAWIPIAAVGGPFPLS